MCSQHGEREILLLLGLPLIGTGLLCLAITNCMVNRENKAFVTYLNLKVYIDIKLENINKIRKIYSFVSCVVGLEVISVLVC